MQAYVIFFAVTLLVGLTLAQDQNVNADEEQLANFCRTGCTRLPADRRANHSPKGNKLELNYAHAFYCQSNTNEKMECFTSLVYKDDFRNMDFTTGQQKPGSSKYDVHTTVLNWYNGTNHAFNTMAFDTDYYPDSMSYVYKMGSQIHSYTRVVSVGPDYNIMHGCVAMDINDPDNCGQWWSVSSTKKKISKKSLRRAMAEASRKGLPQEGVQMNNHANC